MQKPGLLRSFGPCPVLCNAPGSAGVVLHEALGSTTCFQVYGYVCVCRVRNGFQKLTEDKCGLFALSQELLTQNRRFVRGFHQSSSHVTKYHACHGICTLSPLRAALAIQVAKNTEHDTSKVLPMSRTMTPEVSKPRKLQRIF